MFLTIFILWILLTLILIIQFFVQFLPENFIRVILLSWFILCFSVIIGANNANDFPDRDDGHNSCEVCDRSYEPGDSEGNYMNIFETGMCNNCWRNFQWANEQKKIYGD